MMKHLCAVRHGSYDIDSGHLSQYGIDNIEELAEVLYKEFGRSSTPPVIISSDFLRSIETAQIIAKKFGVVAVRPHRFLSCEAPAGPAGIERVYRLVKHYEKQGVENLILSTHEMQATFLPAFFADEEFGLEWEDPKVDMNMGWIIDCEAKTFRYI